MFVSYIHEKYLSQDWINGEVINDALVEPVNAARSFFKENGYDHEWVYRLWEGIEERFYLWKKEYGQPPVKNPLAPNSPIDYDAPPYLCAGDGINCYADLLAQRIIPDKYEYFKKPIELELEWMLYAIVLLEAASRGDDKAVHKTFQQLVKYKITANKKTIDALHAELQPIKVGQRKGGETTAKIKKDEGAKTKERVLKSAKKRIGKVPERNLIGSIMRDTILTRPTVTEYLEELRKDGKLPNKA